MVMTFDKNTLRTILETFLRCFSLFYQERYIVQFNYKCAKQTTTCLTNLRQF